jgi:DNA-binding transcriptional LysR family regulator
MVPAPHAAPYLADGRLLRLLPEWSADAGPLAIYYSSKKLLPAKTRVFVDFVVDYFRKIEFASRIARI